MKGEYSMSISKEIERTHLGGAKLLVYLYILEAEEIHISLRDLSKMLGVGVNTLSRDLDELEREGFIKAQKSEFRRNGVTYSIVKREKERKFKKL